MGESSPAPGGAMPTDYQTKFRPGTCRITVIRQDGTNPHFQSSLHIITIDIDLTAGQLGDKQRG